MLVCVSVCVCCWRSVKQRVCVSFYVCVCECVCCWRSLSRSDLEGIRGSGFRVQGSGFRVQGLGSDLPGGAT